MPAVRSHEVHQSFKSVSLNSGMQDLEVRREMLTGTIGDRIRTTSHTRGFDYLRIFLALCIVGWHSIYVSGNEGVLQFVLHSWLGPFKALVLPMFFTLSGFLVAGSMERSRTLEGFATLRVLRIVPALAVEILLSVFLLGTVVTTLPLKDYFGDPKTRLYLLNVFGDVHYLLLASSQTIRVQTP